jgi:hypothetical protein
MYFLFMFVSIYVYIYNYGTRNISVLHNIIRILYIYFSTLTGIVKEGVLNYTWKDVLHWTAIERKKKVWWRF